MLRIFSEFLDTVRAPAKVELLSGKFRSPPSLCSPTLLPPNITYADASNSLPYDLHFALALLSHRIYNY